MLAYVRASNRHEDPIEHVFDGLVAVANASCIVLGLGFVSIQLAPFATLRAFWVREF
jgi:hypothetical protein